MQDRQSTSRPVWRATIKALHTEETRDELKATGRRYWTVGFKLIGCKDRGLCYLSSHWSRSYPLTGALANAY